MSCGTGWDSELPDPGVCRRLRVRCPTRHEPCFMSLRSHQANHAGTWAISRAVLPSAGVALPCVAVAAQAVVAVRRRDVPQLPALQRVDSSRSNGERRTRLQLVRRVRRAPAGQRDTVRRMRAETESPGPTILIVREGAR